VVGANVRAVVHINTALEYLIVDLRLLPRLRLRRGEEMSA